MPKEAPEALDILETQTEQAMEADLQEVSDEEGREMNNY